MKKKLSLFTLAGVTLLLSVVAFAQRFESWAPSDAKDASAVAQQPSMTKKAPVQNASFRAPKSVTRRAIASVDELVGNYVAISAVNVYNSETKQLELDEVPVNGVATVITKIDDTHIGITGLVPDATDAVTAEVNLTEGTLTIADGQTLFTNATYGPIVMANASAEGALTATVTADGITIDQIWCDLLGGDGDYAGYLWSGNYFAGTTLKKSNAVMAYTNASANFNNGPANVYVEQEGAKATVYNFANQGFVVDIDLKPTQEISIAKQEVSAGSTTTGAFYTYGVEGNNLLDEIVGTGTESVLTFPGSWTFYSDNSYWYNLYTETTITMNEGSSIVYPALDIDISPATGSDISAAITEAKGTAAKLGNVKITLEKDGAYTLSTTIKAGGNITINGNGATIDASAGDNIIGIDGVTEFAKSGDGTDTEYSFVSAITFKDVTITGMTKALVRDLMANKTLLETLTIDNCVMQVSNAKPFIDFDSRGYVGKVVVKNSTIWAAAPTEKNFAKYGSKPANINAELKQEFDVQNSTIVNIAAKVDFSGGQNLNNTKLQGTANNIYTLKNNIFVNCGKSGQVVVGFNGGQTSATPVWDVDKNAFNWNGADVSETEASKAGKKDEVDIVKNSVAGIIAFASETAIADGNFKLANCAQNTSHIGDPRWLDATAEPEAENITISPASGNISDALFSVTGAVNKKAKNITINLAEGAAYTVNAPIVPGGSVVINGAAGATIDASALAGNFIEMAAVENPTEWTAADVTIKGVTLKGLKKALFYSTNKKYIAENFIIDNCVVEQAADATTIDYTKGSTAKNITVTNSTFYAPTATTKAFYSSQGGEKYTEYEADGMQTFTFKNNTMYNLAPTKNFFSHRQSNQKWLAYDVENNVFVNCGKSGQVIKGMNGGQGGANPTWTIKGNVFNFNGADTSANEETGDADEPVQNSIVAIVTFTDAAAGDFNAQLGVPVVPADPIVVGDPRWTLTVAQAPFDIVVNAADITDGKITDAITAASAGKLVKGITVNLAAETAYTVTAPIVAPANITINGNGATIDASALEGNFIEMAAVEEPTEWTAADVTIKGVTLKGLKKALFYSTNKKYIAENFIIDNCVVEQAADATTIDYTKGSTAKNITVTNSTFYAPTATTKAFYSSQGGEKYTEYDTSAEAMQTFTFKNNTMYNLAPTKNFFSHRQSNQTWLAYDVENNVFVNCGKSGQVIKGMNGGQGGANPTWTIKGNVFNFNGVDTSANEETGDTTEGETVQDSYAGCVIFADAAAGVFNFTFIAASGATAPTAVGDPRWTMTTAKFYIFGDVTETGWSAVTTEMTFNGETQAYEYEFEATKDVWFAFSDTEFATTDGNWEAVNAARYSLGGAEPTIGTAQDLVKGVDSSIKLPAGTWKASVSADMKTLTITGEAAPEPGEDTYVVAGSPVALFGTEWDGTAEANQMTKNEETGIYEKKYEGVALTAGTIEYKIVKNGSAWIPDGMGNNLTIAIEADGTYDVVFTFNPETNAITGVATMATGIYGISVDGANDIFSDGKPVYNLSGQRVFKGYKGVVIKNGKKIVVK